MKAITTKASVFGLVMAGLISQNVAAQCLVTTGPTNDCSYGDAIDNFTLGTVTATNAGCSNGSGYSSYATPVFNLTLDSTSNLSATTGGGMYNQGLGVWIDLNNNGEFEAAEQVYVSTAAALNHTGTITVPASFPGVVTGVQLPMRVMCTYNMNPAAGSACTSGQGSYGETEDYLVVLSPAGGNPTTSNVAANAVFEPADNDCGDPNDEVWVTIENLTANAEDTVPVTLNLSGMVTGTYMDTVFNLTGSSTQNLLMATIDTEAGGTLVAELITGLSDDDSSDDTLTVTINISSSVAISMSGTATLCEGDSSMCMVNNVDSSEVYTWYVDGVMATTGFTFNTGALSANAQVVVASSNACRANDTLDITVNPNPTASYTFVHTNGVVDYTGTATNADTVYWDFGDGNMGTGMTPTHTYTAGDDYTVCFYAINACDTTEFCDTVQVTIMSVDEFAGGTVRVFPNPTHDDVKIEMSGMEGFGGNWTLYAMDGKELDSEKIKVTSATTELIISLGNYAVGTYILEITNDNGDVLRKELVRN